MPVGPDIVAAVSARLAEHAGLDLPDWLVEARVANRISALKMSAPDYVELIASSRGASELDRLIEAVRVGETKLFRHRGQIRALVHDLVPRLRSSRKRALKIWSAGCSTGEEPYTLAAVLSQALPGVSISVLATDVSTEALDIARRGRYPAQASADIPNEWADAFIVEPDEVRVRPEVAALVTFERANLLEGRPRSGFDLVWCRNVLIYFMPETRQRVVDKLIGALVPGGYLFVGSSESLHNVASLEAVRGDGAVYYMRSERPGARHSVPEPIEHHLELTPPPMRIPVAPPHDERLVIGAKPTASEVAAAVSSRLAIVGLRRLVIDLDRAELLDDSIGPTLARARAAARAADVELVLEAKRPGTRRWLARHSLDTEESGNE